MQVQGGFILGLDGDGEGVFDAMIEFIREVGIPVAPIYLLTALKGTDMYERLKRENRLVDVPIGTNATILNFRTEMDRRTLIEGYIRVTATLYDPTLANYLDRCLTLLRHLEPVPHLHKPKSRNAVYADLMGLRGRLSAGQIPVYMKYIARVSRDHPRLLPMAIRLAAMGYHLEKITRQQNAIRDFMDLLTGELERFDKAIAQEAGEAEEVLHCMEDAFRRAQGRYESIPDEFRYDGDGIETALESFRSEVNARAERLDHSAVV